MHAQVIPDDNVGQHAKQAKTHATNGSGLTATNGDAVGNGSAAAYENGAAVAADKPNGQRRVTRPRRESTWLKEEQRCRHPAALIDFLNSYSQLVRLAPRTSRRLLLHYNSREQTLSPAIPCDAA